MSATPYPVTVIRARYGGTYEGAPWLAFHCYPWDVPEEAMGDDTTCAGFWSWREDVGRGASPDMAVLDLRNRLAEPRRD